MADNGNIIVFDEPERERKPRGLMPCSCGCGKLAPMHRLRTVRAKNKGAFYVLDECKEAFEAELENRYKLNEIFQSTIGFPCWRRWQFGRVVWLLTYLRLSRLFGERVSRKRATRQTVLYCLPNRWARFISPRWKVPPDDRPRPCEENSRAA